MRIGHPRQQREAKARRQEIMDESSSVANTDVWERRRKDQAQEVGRALSAGGPECFLKELGFI